ncbi:CBS domain-containing protein [Streptococcaceae bacterium ESL0729]|nr:CBS domain-containing protein [Streptococcaceae bacterium ESL0729]
MIDKKIENFLLAQSATFLKPAADVAVLLDEHHITHAKLLLSQYKYANVPVINKDWEYVGILGLTEIVDFENHTGLQDQENESDQTQIGQIVNKDIETVQINYSFEDVLRKLTRQSFLPVLDGKDFIGIIPRQEILKAFSAFVHDFTKYYKIEEKFDKHDTSESEQISCHKK